MQASSLELVFDTMTCLFQHLGSRAVPMLPFLGSVLHMLTYSLPAILGPVGAAEEHPTDEDDDESDKDAPDHGLAGADAEPKSGAQATATYYAAVQVGVGLWWSWLGGAGRGGFLLKDGVRALVVSFIGVLILFAGVTRYWYLVGQTIDLKYNCALRLRDFITVKWLSGVTFLADYCLLFCSPMILFLVFVLL